MTLISASQMASIQAIGELGMQSIGYIWDYADTTTATGTEPGYTRRTESVKCWVYSTPTPVITIVSGQQALVNTYRLFLPVGTDIETGDRFEVDGEMFTVSDTIKESTYQAMLVVSLRRVE